MAWKDPEKRREYNRKYREANAEKLREYSRNYYAANKEAWRRFPSNQPERKRADQLLRKYGLTPEDRFYMEVDQAGCCLICGEPEGSALHVDHCHARGLVRGLLCGNCNRALGIMDDDPGRLRAAADYIEQHQGEIDE